MKKTKSGKSPFDDKRIVLIVSLLTAFLSWVVVAGFIQPGDDIPIKDIIIDYKKTESSYKNLNLIMVGEKPAVYANAIVQGNNSLISSLKSGDISIYPDFRSVTGPGVFDVDLRYEKIASGDYDVIQWGIGNNYSQTIKVEFEELLTKSLPIGVKADNVNAAEGFFREDTPKPEKTEVEIEGAASIVNKIVSAVAIVDDNTEGEESLTFDNVPVKFFDADGIEVDISTISVSVESTDVEIPILKEGILQLGIDFSGVRNNFDTQWLHSLARFSQDSIHVAARSDIIEGLPETYIIDTIDVSEIVQGVQFEIPLVLPGNIRNRDNVESVFVSFDLTSLKSQTMTIPVRDVRVINVQTGLEVEVVDERALSVALVGDGVQIDELLPENVFLQIDAYNISAIGRQEIPARVVISKSDRVFAIGSYKVMCEVREAEENEGG